MLVQQYSMLMLVSLFIKWKKEAKATLAGPIVFFLVKQTKNFVPLAGK
jgi:hypothetical protein